MYSAYSHGRVVYMNTGPRCAYICCKTRRVWFLRFCVLRKCRCGRNFLTCHVVCMRLNALREHAHASVQRDAMHAMNARSRTHCTGNLHSDPGHRDETCGWYSYSFLCRPAWKRMDSSGNRLKALSCNGWEFGLYHCRGREAIQAGMFQGSLFSVCPSENGQNIAQSVRKQIWVGKWSTEFWPENGQISVNLQGEERALNSAKLLHSRTDPNTECEYPPSQTRCTLPVHVCAEMLMAFALVPQPDVFFYLLDLLRKKCQQSNGCALAKSRRMAMQQRCMTSMAIYRHCLRHAYSSMRNFQSVSKTQNW